MIQKSADGVDDRVLPLEGIRVIDTATLLAGPLATTFLGEFGADVVKVEGPHGDPMREWPPHNDGESVTWHSVARNKRSLVLDLHDPAGRSRLIDLLREADVFVTNFRVSTLSRWGLDYEDVRVINPRLVMLHVTGFGRTGPYRDRPGFARIAEAFAGLTHITGEPDREPIFAGYPMGDAICGLYGAYSVLLALRARDLSGRGGLVDLGLYEPTLRLLDDLVPGYLNTGHVKERRGNRQDHSVPNGLFPTSDGSFVVMPVSTPNMWDRLTRLIDDPSLVEFDTLASRVANREQIDTAVAAYTVQYTADDLVETMAERGIACGKINSAKDIAEDPHVQARGNFIRVPGWAGEESVAVMAPIPASDLFRGEVNWAGPPLGMPPAVSVDEAAPDA